MTKKELAAAVAIDGNIANWLRRNNKTSEELASILGISTGALSNKRTQNSKWNLGEIVRLMETLDCDFETLTS
jgi:DNA-binding Xre family transcriptional regulator